MSKKQNKTYLKNKVKSISKKRTVRKEKDAIVFNINSKEELEELSRNASSSFKQVDVGAIFKKTFNKYMENLFINLIIMLLPCIVYFSVFLPRIVFQDRNLIIGTAIVLQLISCLLFGFVSVVMIKMFDLNNNSNTRLNNDLNKVVRYSISRFIDYLKVMAINFAVVLLLMSPTIVMKVFFKQDAMAVLLFLGAFATVVYLSSKFGQAWIITILTPQVGNPFTESDRITDGNKWGIVMTFLVLFIISFVAELVVLGPAVKVVVSMQTHPSTFITTSINLIIALIYYPFINAFYYSIYKELA